MLYFFCFNETATTEIYTYLHTLSLHDALPISGVGGSAGAGRCGLSRNPFRVADQADWAGPDGAKRADRGGKQRGRAAVAAGHGAARCSSASRSEGGGLGPDSAGPRALCLVAHAEPAGGEGGRSPEGTGGACGSAEGREGGRQYMCASGGVVSL